MRNAKIFLLVLLAALFSSGCNTLQGMGKDMKQGGEAIERAAKK
ncbi:MAG: entericidin A/B family lipoprotein [Pseudomonadota bacterium]